MKVNRPGRRSAAKEVAVCSVMTAILIGGQAAFAPVSGIEIVTVLLLTFSWSFGPRPGVLTAISFSILRCFLWGFHPPTIALYLLYYPLFAFLFGMIGQKRTGISPPVIWLAEVLLIAIAVACAFFAATSFLKLSILKVASIKGLLWFIFAGCLCLLFLLNSALLLIRFRSWAKTFASVISITAVAAFCTICFTLLDDVLTPMYYGWEWGKSTFLGYFYASFLALVPQTLCTIITVSSMFLPLTKAFFKLTRSSKL